MTHIHHDAVMYTGTKTGDGKAHLAVLVLAGLQPDSKVLEIGCGALHGGTEMIKFLDPGCYCGIDPNSWIREFMIEEMDNSGVLAEKSPRFSSREDFDGSEFNNKFDFVFSHSVLSHAATWQFGLYLRNTKKVLAPRGKIVTSFFLAEGSEKSGQPGTADKQDSGEDFWVYPDRSFFTMATVEREAEEAGLTVEIRPDLTEMVQTDSLQRWPALGHCHDWLIFQEKA